MQGNDVIVGGGGNDTLVGGTGDDQLNGADGNNTYVFNRGDGVDSINAFDHTSTKQNVIAFGADIAPSDLLAFRDNDHLRIMNTKSGDSILVHRFFVSELDYGRGPAYRPWGIEKVTFETGETWTYSDLVKLAAGPAQALGAGGNHAFGYHLLGQDGNDFLDASGPAVLHGGAGDDRLFGSYTDDLLEGGTGNDIIDGRGGNDMFVFGRGWGQDRIILRGWGASTDIHLTGMLAGELAVTRKDNDLVLTSKTSTDSITLVAYFMGEYGGANATVSITFANGSSWNGPQIEGQLYGPPGLKLTGTAANDQLSGQWGNDVLIGGGGFDHLSGFEGNDVLAGGADTEMMDGGAGHDTYLPGAGDAYIRDKGGDNLLVFGRDAGTYHLEDLWQATSMTIALTTDVTPGDIDVIRSGSGDVHIVIAGTPARLIMPEMVLLDPFMDGKLRLAFSDGQVWSGSGLRSQLFNGSDMPDTIRGTFADDIMQGHGERDLLEGMGGDDRLFGGAGDDTLMGMSGNDHLYGGEGNDSLFGHEGDDVLCAGGGIDHLDGGDGNNTYLLGQSDYLSFIQLAPYSYNGIKGKETVRFESGIDPGAMTVSYDSNLRELTLTTAYKKQTVVLRNFDLDAAPQAPDVWVRFADGTAWNRTSLRERLLIGDEQDNNLVGGSGADVIVGNDGNDRLLGEAGDDRLHGGRGSDLLQGGDGKDTYLFDKGDGQDVLYEQMGPGEQASVFQFGPNVAADDIRMYTEGSTLLIKYGVGDGITVKNFVPGQSYANFILATKIVLIVGEPKTLGAYYHVNSAPVAGVPMPDAYVSTYGKLVYTIPASAFSDADAGDTSLLSVTLDDGKPLPQWLRFDPQTRTLEGSPPAAESGVLALLVTSTDSAMATASAPLRLAVNATPPVVKTPVADAVVNESSSLQLRLDGTTFYDPDYAEQLTLSVTQANGAPLPAWLNYSAATAYLSGTPLEANVGVLDLLFNATDKLGNKVSDAFRLTIKDVNFAPVVSAPASTIAAMEGTSFAAAAPRFTDPDRADVLTVTLTLDNGQPLPQWLSYDGATGMLGGVPSFDNSGSYLLRASASDGKLSISSVFSLQVANTNRAPTVASTITDLALSEGVAFSAALPTFTDPDSGESMALPPTVTVTMADGSPLPGWMTFNTGTNTLAGTPGMTDSGSYALKASATDSAGLAVSSAFGVNVANTNQAPVLVNPVADQSATEGTAFSLVLAPNVFNDADAGDTGSLSAAALPGWLSFNPATRAFSGTPAYADIAASNISVSWTDAGGLKASDTFTVTVAQVTPVSLTGTAAADVLTGKSNADTLSGLGGDDTLDGGLGGDRMLGGLGNDVYHVDNTADVVLENASEGTDTVISVISYTLPANVEKLTLAGTAALNATGNALGNTLTGNSGANVLDGGAGVDSMAGGAGNDIYIVDSTSDTVSETSASGGFDQVLSSVARSLGLHQEMLTFSGTGAVNGTGNVLANVLQGNVAVNTLNGGDGSDILQGGAGDDVLQDSSSAGNLFDGGAGADRLTGNTGNDMFIGGAGNDTIATGSGVDIIAFNRGDGDDAVAVTSGADNVVSLGRGIRYADLALGKSGNDLVFHLGAGDSITFKGWYSSTNARSVGTLQVMTEGGDYVAGSANALTDHKVELFNFTALAAKFDQVRVSMPGSSTWNVAQSLASFSSGGSDSAAIGGDLAYQYAVAGSLSGIAAAPALAIIGSPSFGTSQTLQGGSALNDGTPMLY